MPPKLVRKYLLINPNTSALTTQRLEDTLRPQLPQGVELELRTATFGARYIACEASHAVAAHACLDVWAQAIQAPSPPLDGVLIGCFGDPGLFALRESSACPVTGLAEASFIEAAALGPFAIVTGGERWKPMLERLAQSLGFGQQLRHIETVAPTGAALLADPDMALQCLGQACQQAMRPGVRAIIMGGAGLAGYAKRLQPHCPLPLIDSVQAGLALLLAGKAPPASRSASGFTASWTQMSAAMTGLQVKD